MGYTFAVSVNAAEFPDFVAALEARAEVGERSRFIRELWAFWVANQDVAPVGATDYADILAALARIERQLKNNTVKVERANRPDELSFTVNRDAVLNQLKGLHGR